MNGIKRIALVSAFLLTPGLGMADDLSNSSAFLCTAVFASQCTPDGECEGGPAWNYNIPQFIEIDLDKKLVSTTKASGENRTTPIKNLEREGGLIFLQGVQLGRAFSFVINEETGIASIAIALDGRGVIVSGACTPLPVSN